VEHSQPNGQAHPPVSLATEDWALINAVSEHFAKHLGTADRVWHETLSPLVHVDVHIIEPTEQHPYTTLFTTGMAQVPMNAPPGRGMPIYAELMMRLPPEWKVDNASLATEEWGWPVRILTVVARYPHLSGRLVFLGNTLAFEEPPEPIASTVGFSAVLLGLPSIATDKLHLLPCGDDRRGLLYAVIPIYTEELDLARQQGTGALIRALMKHRVSDLVDITRRNVAKRKWLGLF
jgi:hypothetical protein